MRMVTYSDRPDVDLLGLGWGDVALIEACLAEKAVIDANDAVAARAIELIELIDAGTQSQLRAHLGPHHGKEPDNL